MTYAAEFARPDPLPAIARRVGRVALRALARVTIRGERALYTPGPVIYAANHVSTFDAMLFFLLLLYIVVRSERIAAGLVLLIGGAAISLTHDNALGVPFACLGAFLVVWVLYRYGLLALISAIFFLHLTIFFPMTSDLSAWYAADFVLALIISLTLAGFAFYTSLAGQPLFRTSLPDD